MIDKEELDVRLEELEEDTNEYESLCFLRDLFYLQEEGFIEIEDDRVYPKDEACLSYLDREQHGE